MPAVALVIEFDGTDFVGWQIQDNGRSVQEEIQRALTTLYKEEIKVTLLVLYYLNNDISINKNEFSLIIKKAITFLEKNGINYEDILNTIKN